MGQESRGPEISTLFKILPTHYETQSYKSSKQSPKEGRTHYSRNKNVQDVQDTSLSEAPCRQACMAFPPPPNFDSAASIPRKMRRRCGAAPLQPGLLELGGGSRSPSGPSLRPLLRPSASASRRWHSRQYRWSVVSLSPLLV